MNRDAQRMNKWMNQPINQSNQPKNQFNPIELKQNYDRQIIKI